MGKNIFFGMLVLSLLGVSCRNANDDAQKIDQRVQIYIDSAGQDMLNSKIMGSYQSIVLNDVYGDTDVATVPLTLKKNTDTTYYIEYLLFVIFPLYYTVQGQTIYKATVVDFAINHKELSEKNWPNKYEFSAVLERFDY